MGWMLLSLLPLRRRPRQCPHSIANAQCRCCAPPESRWSPQERRTSPWCGRPGLKREGGNRGQARGKAPRARLGGLGYTVFVPEDGRRRSVVPDGDHGDLAVAAAVAVADPDIHGHGHAASRHGVGHGTSLKQEARRGRSGRGKARARQANNVQEGSTGLWKGRVCLTQPPPHHAPK